MMVLECLHIVTLVLHCNASDVTMQTDYENPASGLDRILKNSYIINNKVAGLYFYSMLKLATIFFVVLHI